ncbi:MAG TPA: hypothetical protein VL979_06230 [Solirubrobacteraceae bacterium]|nr:hypothetical protein [Solirubrobacteraceae bacterium]
MALLTGVLVSLVASATAQAGSFEVQRLVATNCKEAFESCGSEEVGPYTRPKEKVTVAEAHEQGFTEAGGRVPNGVTDFEVSTTGEYPEAEPTGVVNHVRVDVAAGLATAPTAVPQCSAAEFDESEFPVVGAGTGLYTDGEPSGCTQIGIEKITVFIPSVGDVPISGKVYNLVPPERSLAKGEKPLASYYGVSLALPKFITEAKSLGSTQYYVHSYVEGSVEWGKEAEGTEAADYHDYFEVTVNPELPLVSSRQVLYGTTDHDFITNATSCPGDNTTYVTLKDTAGETTRKSFTTPIGLEGCNSLKFEPTIALESGSSASDEPNPFSTEVSMTNEPEERAQAQVKTASITLPEGMTLNPSAAHGLEACTVAQARIHSSTFGVACPSGSELGTVSLEVPTLEGAVFTGHVYLGGPVSGSETGPITGPPYIIYVVADSERYGISVRLKAEVIPNETTGQVTTVFNENPEQPFTNLSIDFNRNVLTSVANPLQCGTPEGSSSFVPVSSETPAKNASFGGLSVTGCASSIPFSLGQAVENETTKAGGHTSYDIRFTRNNGEQYLQKVKTVLPPGIVGAIPAVTLCGESEANAGSCGAASKIGTVTVQAGSGSAPYTFNGSVYMTGPYDGAPFGLSIVVPAVAGPFNLGDVVTRSTININQTTAQVTAESTLPTIYKGIPLRLRSINVDVDKQGFLFNPTSCSPLTTESALTSSSGAVQSALKSTFQLESCGSLAFKPAFTASTGAHHSKANGASLVTTIDMGAGQSNIKSVFVQIPKALPSRLTTLQKACLAQVFEANPLNCRTQSPGSEVGTAKVVTPTLPVPMTGPAFFVSHAGEEFPSLELVLEGDGVKIVVEGKTHIKNGITTTDFEANPDVPISSVTVNLPTGPHSMLTTEKLNTNLCTQKLVMPTVITGQNGTVVKQNTIIKPSKCGVQIVGHKVVGDTAYLTVRTYAPGRISGGGKDLKTVYKKLAAAHKAVTLKVPLGRKGRARRRPFTLKVRVGFVPKVKGAHSATHVKVKFRR